MFYLGGKSRISKYIVPLMEDYRLNNQAWVEPFVGGCNTIADACGVRYGNDIRSDLIDMWEAVTYNKYEPPETINKEMYYTIKNSSRNFTPELRAFVSVGCSFGGKEWGGYAKNKNGRNYVQESRRGLMQKARKLHGVIFSKGSYDNMYIPPKSIIYCDPPYKNSTGYNVEFDHDLFWKWCRAKASEDHTVFISEYEAPEDFIEIWRKSWKCNLSDSKKDSIEKLFMMSKSSVNDRKNPMFSFCY
tara:strand:+ start:101 stop:835 length:735 start_codon:yes stop_codon:yes gene_type:complete